jgi:site-specific recombinase XerC
MAAATPGPLDDALDRYLAHLRVERALQPATLESYARDLREYLEWLAAREVTALAQVAQIQVLQHVASLQQRGLSRASQARHLAAVRGLHRFAAAEGLAPIDPTEGVEASRGSRPLPDFLGVEEVDRLLAQPEAATPSGERDRAPPSIRGWASSACAARAARSASCRWASGRRRRWSRTCAAPAPRCSVRGRAATSSSRRAAGV